MLIGAEEVGAMECIRGKVCIGWKKTDDGIEMLFVDIETPEAIKILVPAIKSAARY